MSIRYGVKWDEDEGNVTVRAVESGRRIAEVEFAIANYDSILQYYWEFLIDENGDEYPEGTKLRRCGLSYENIERDIGRTLYDFLMVQDGQTSQLSMDELEKFWRAVVLGAGRQGLPVMAPNCTEFLSWGMYDDTRRIPKVWRSRQFRSGLMVSGPVAYMQLALGPARAANPHVRPFSTSGPRHEAYTVARPSA